MFVRPLSCNTVVLIFICVAASTTSSFLGAEQYEIVGICHNLFIHSSVERHSSDFQFEDIMNKASVSILFFVQVFGWTRFRFSWINIIPRSGLLLEADKFVVICYIAIENEYKYLLKGRLLKFC